MRPPSEEGHKTRRPQLIAKTLVLQKYLKNLSTQQIASIMKISPKLAATTHTLINNWSDSTKYQREAIDSFLGDIYSGLQVQDWTKDDRKYADEKLRILSGLYGILRPLDGIYPYRYEMGYRLPDYEFSNMYNFWGDSIARTLPKDSEIINLTAVEYSKAVLPYLDKQNIITPVFLTINGKTKKPTFVVVHTKIARGAFASWMIKNRIDKHQEIKNFKELNYEYDQSLSTANEPVFVCREFGGIGLSIRLK